MVLLKITIFTFLERMVLKEHVHLDQCNIKLRLLCAFGSKNNRMDRKQDLDFQQSIYIDQ